MSSASSHSKSLVDRLGLEFWKGLSCWPRLSLYLIFFPSTMAKEAFLLTTLLFEGKSYRTQNLDEQRMYLVWRLKIVCKKALKEALKYLSPHKDLFEKCFCSSALHGKTIELIIRTHRGGLGLKTQNGLLWWPQWSFEISLSQTNWLENVYDYLLGRGETTWSSKSELAGNGLGLKTSNSLFWWPPASFEISPSQTYCFKKRFCSRALERKNHIELSIQTEREWACFEDLKRFVMRRGSLEISFPIRVC